MEQFLQEYIDSPFAIAVIVLIITWLPTFLPVPTEQSGKWYHAIYKILNALAANVGKAKNANTPPVKQKPVDKTLSIIVLSMFLVSGCALKSLEPHEQGIAVAQELTEAYYAVEELYFDMPPESQAKVAPMLNTYRHSLVLLRDSASLWYKTKTKPDDFDALAESLSNILQDINNIMSNNG